MQSNDSFFHLCLDYMTGLNAGNSMVLKLLFLYR